MSGTLRNYLVAWLVLTALTSFTIYQRAHIELGAIPDASSARWAQAALNAARRGQALPQAPASAERFLARGPVFVTVFLRGNVQAQHVGKARFATAVREAAQAFARDKQLGFPDKSSEPLRFRVGVTRGRAPLFDLIPGLRLLTLVPLHDGLSATLGGQTEYLTPDEILALGLYDRAIAPPVPDLTLGTDIDALCARLAARLHVSADTLRARGHVERLRIDTLPAVERSTAVTRKNLETAVLESARFIVRHQARSGRYAYVYDAQLGRGVPRGSYSLPRHAGATFFLAQVAATLGSQPARAAALRALEYVRKQALATCGAPDRLCVLQGHAVEIGGSALTALAAAELLQSGDDPAVRELLAGLTAFLRAQQRPDGELMHEYDRAQQKPKDVQYMYYSGEAAMALLRAYEITRDPRDLKSAERLMRHLTEGAWSFFGSRYFYGEEHWTCQAVGKAAAYMDMTSAVDFCMRWAKWQHRLQYGPGETPWLATGAFGVGPVILPRITTASSRVEAAVPIYRVLSANDRDRRVLQDLIERSLGLLLRMRWAPGPDHLFRNPAAAYGGMPGTEADLRSRVDMVQHAGSAMLAWLKDAP